jgi:hypothetical protein
MAHEKRKTLLNVSFAAVQSELQTGSLNELQNTKTPPEIARTCNYIARGWATAGSTNTGALEDAVKDVFFVIIW